MLKVAIDAHMVGQRETGNETYVLGLLRGLAEIDSYNRYFVLAIEPTSLRSRIHLPANFTIVPLRPAANMVRVPLTMPWVARQLGVDVLHVTYIAPPVSPCPVVVTVHDVSFKIFPDFFSLRDRLLLSTLVPLSMRRAAHIIADSECTKADIITHYGLPSAQVVVTLAAPDAHFSPVRDAGQLRAMCEKYGLTEGFILTVGNLQPRKNLDVLVSAIAVLKSRGALHRHLAVVGQSRWQAHRILDQVEQAGLEHEVRFLGYVPSDDLPALYSAAHVFVFPSLYEGFGLPPLEAMACGTPVISSRSGGLEEVVGDAGLLLPPQDVLAWANAMQSVLEDPALRDELGQRSLDRAAQFSWKKMARETLEVYQCAAGLPEIAPGVPEGAR